MMMHTWLSGNKKFSEWWYGFLMCLCGRGSNILYLCEVTCVCVVLCVCFCAPLCGPSQITLLLIRGPLGTLRYI